MKLLSGWLRPVWWLLVLGVPPLAAQAPLTILKIEIKHVGPPAVSDELIRANIRLKEGDAYLRNTVDDDVRNLYATGFFYNIRVGEEASPQGVTLTYVVQGKPKLTEIRFQGNTKYSRRKLLSKVTSKPGEPLDERKLFTDSQEILKLYQKAGYQKTQVKYALNIEEAAGRGVATFEITEAPKVKIDRIDFLGAEAFTQKKLRKQIKTRGHWMFSWITGSNILKDEQFDEDKERLTAFYREQGYIDFEIRDIQFENIRPNRLVIRFVVAEGLQYKVGAITFEGNKLFKTEELGAALRMKVGDTFTPRGLIQNLEALQDTYGARGYIDAQIRSVKNPNTVTGTMDLVFTVDERQQSFIEKIDIKGNVKTKDRVLRRELAVSPGEVFDITRVKISRQRLEGLNYFEKVDAQPEPTEVPNRKNLVIGVEEKSTGNFSIGAGFSSIDEIVGFVEVSQGNFDLFNPPYFTGGGQKVRLRLQVGTERQDYQLSFVEPWFLGRKLALGLDLYHRDLEFVSDEYDEVRTGGRLSLTRALGSDFLIGSVSYTLENVTIDNVSPTASTNIMNEAGTRLVSKIGGSLTYDTRGAGFLPERGQRTELSGELAGGPLGGETDFYRLELRSAWYFRGLSRGHVLELTGRIGVVESYGDSVSVPLFDRWYLGGLYTLRGFDYREVGPKDATGEPIGGNTYWFGSIEYSVPIIERLRFAVFYDIGMVYQDAYSFTDVSGSGSYNDNFGFGVRLNLPIGPLRLDYGIPINSDRFNESSGQFQFGVGYTREF
jgi:outer membrane protein insertion porin family